jgi:predicted exporter
MVACQIDAEILEYIKGLREQNERLRLQNTSMRNQLLVASEELSRLRPSVEPPLTRGDVLHRALRAGA